MYYIIYIYIYVCMCTYVCVTRIRTTIPPLLRGMMNLGLTNSPPGPGAVTNHRCCRSFCCELLRILSDHQVTRSVGYQRWQILRPAVIRKSCDLYHPNKSANR